MLKYLRLYRLILRTFGFRVRPIGTFALLNLHHALSGTTMALDSVLYRGWRKMPIDRPVFILGNPRSGTTFLHRFLLESQRLCAFELWEMLLPAITARKAFGGVIDAIKPLSPARYHSAAAHETGLRDVETDDAMAFFRFVDGGFLWSYFLAWEDQWGSELSQRMFDEKHEPARDRERLFRFFEACWRRNLYFKGKSRIAVKASTFSLRVPTLLERYPDCKLIYMVRDPVENIPSGMSMLTDVLEKSYDMFHATRPEARSRYLENLYQASCQMFRGFHDVYRSGAIPEKNLRIVTYGAMMGDLEGTMKNLLEFLEIDPDPSFHDRVREQADKQRKRKSPHVYSLEKFGLDEARIRKDLAFVYETYGV
ncbi:MAG: sulfotransferase [Deltaproteobacteria bacterium]|nr:sulfotransferase [Deltaproteobacteria bacterium]